MSLDHGTRGADYAGASIRRETGLRCTAQFKLRIHCLQLWFDLSDPAVEEALYDSRAMRSFVGLDLGREPVPNETTVMRFRHLLEDHQLGEKIFEEVGRVLLRRGLRLSKGTIVDATIIAAPSSKNAEGERDPEMHQTKKGNEWHFGHEGARGRRQPEQGDSLGGGDAGQHGRLQGDGSTAARSRDTGLR